MAYRMKRPPMRLIVSVVAVLLVAVAVPISTAIADGMNDMIGEKEKLLYRADTVDKLNPGLPIVTTDPSSIGHIRVFHINANNAEKYDVLDAFAAADLGDDLNRVIVQMNDDTYSTDGLSSIDFVFEFGPDYIIDNGVTEVRFTISSDTDKVLKITPNRVSFLSFDGTGFNTKTIPFAIETEDENNGYYDGSNYILNITSEPQTYTITFDQVDVLRASVELGDYEKSIMRIEIQNTGPAAGQGIRDGDVFGYMFEVYGTPISGYAISNIFVGILGVSLIVGAVFATPWVGKNTFSRVGRPRRRTGSKRRRW